MTDKEGEREREGGREREMEKERGQKHEANSMSSLTLNTLLPTAQHYYYNKNYTLLPSTHTHRLTHTHTLSHTHSLSHNMAHTHTHTHRPPLLTGGFDCTQNVISKVPSSVKKKIKTYSLWTGGSDFTRGCKCRRGQGQCGARQ